jgi:carboxylesterase type B
MSQSLVLLLGWMQKNIDVLSGDPNRAAIFGQSAWEATPTLYV